MNQELYGNKYEIPKNIINYINSALYSHPTGNGVRRGKFLVRNNYLTYQALKGLKHDFDTMNTNTPEGKIQFELSGGALMRDFVNTKLDSERAGAEIKKEVRQAVTNNISSDLGAGRINEDYKPIKQNSIAVIVNNDNNILLLKRSEDGGWGSGQYALVGGGIENGETPEQACKREIFEETGLNLTGFNERYNITKDGNSENIFAVRFKGDDDNIKLNHEHTSYGWFDINEITYLDTVPHLMEYLKLCFKQY